MKKQNCWEFKKCSREPGGLKAEELGVCLASIDESSSGLNNGLNAGRICWKVAGTFCEGNVVGSFAQKLMSCIHCDFMDKVKEEEGEDFIMTGNEISYHKKSKIP